VGNQRTSTLRLSAPQQIGKLTENPKIGRTTTLKTETGGLRIGGREENKKISSPVITERTAQNLPKLQKKTGLYQTWGKGRH